MHGSYPALCAVPIHFIITSTSATITCSIPEAPRDCPTGTTISVTTYLELRNSRTPLARHRHHNSLRFVHRVWSTLSGGCLVGPVLQMPCLFDTAEEDSA